MRFISSSLQGGNYMARKQSTQFSCRYRYLGFSLIELCLSLFIGLLLLGSLFKVYLIVNATHQMQMALAFINDQSQYLFYYFNEKLHRKKPTDSLLFSSSLERKIKNTDILCLDNSTCYFMATTHRKNRDHQPIRALYEKSANQDAVELAEGIEGM